MGSIIDATNGRVRITTAAGGGKTQTAEFYDGIFKVTQTKGKKPITDLTLVGKLAGCKKGKASERRGQEAQGPAAVGLGKGRFRTQGQALLRAGARHDLAGGGPLQRHHVHARAQGRRARA